MPNSLLVPVWAGFTLLFIIKRWSSDGFEPDSFIYLSIRFKKRLFVALLIFYPFSITDAFLVFLLFEDGFTIFGGLSADIILSTLWRCGDFYTYDCYYDDAPFPMLRFDKSIDKFLFFNYESYVWLVFYPVVVFNSSPLMKSIYCFIWSCLC